MSLQRLKPWLSSLGLVAATAAVAQERPPRWELGAFAVGVSQQAYPGADEQVSRGLVLPYAIYRGDWLRADRDGAGLRAFRTPRFELDLGVSGSFGGGSSDLEARRGLPRLGTLLEAGPRLQWRLGEALDGRWRAEIPLRVVLDASDGLRHRGAAFEPALVYDRVSAGGWRTSTRLGIIAGDRKLADTFYGVPGTAATPTRPAYNARAGLIATRLGVSASVPLSEDWRLFGFARWQTVRGAANEASPLVQQRDGWSGGLGVSYTWMRSRDAAAD
jgi:outer membrane scaffolding protein for murein synthesis (MipA/OmpV family)